MRRIVWLSVGDIVVVRSGAYTGDSALVPKEYAGAIAGFDMVLTVSGADPEFVQYALLSEYLKQGQIDIARTRAAQPHLNSEELGSCLCIVPPRGEQKEIVRFLDCETAKIDALIAEQEQLIATLREDRTATITDAVTKGLNPAVQKRDSGVEWLGAIPQHWSVMKLRYVGQPIIGLTYSPDDVVDDTENSTLVLRSTNIQGGVLDLSDCVYVCCPIPDQLRLQHGDILLCSRNGSRALIGKNVLVDEQVAGQSFGAFMTVFRSEFNVFLYWVFNSRLFHYQTATFLSSTINQLTTGNFKRMEVPFPPAHEQREIVSFLLGRTATIDTLITKCDSVIATLREYRSALITDAVTGKIDVRGAA
jgi:type I restriction enzyme S subunit